MLDSVGVTPQPAPKGGREDVTALVVADLQGRSRAGFMKYGSILRTFNGRKALVDLYQELLDACCYVRQQIAEDQASSDARIVEAVTEIVASGDTTKITKDNAHAVLRFLEELKNQGQL